LHRQKKITKKYKYVRASTHRDKARDRDRDRDRDREISAIIHPRVEARNAKKREKGRFAQGLNPKTCTLNRKHNQKQDTLPSETR
jgi:hypothetical protein